jgi:hypothetical protein
LCNFYNHGGYFDIVLLFLNLKSCAEPTFTWVPDPRKLDMTWLLNPSRLGLTYLPVAKPKTLGFVHDIKCLKYFLYI